MTATLTEMKKRIFESQPFGVAAIDKMGPVSNDFILYLAGWNDDRTIMTVTGAEFFEGKDGVAIKRHGTQKSVELRIAEINSRAQLKPHVSAS